MLSLGSRYGHASCLHTLDLKGKLIREGVYENVLAQGKDVTAMLATGDLDADGEVIANSAQKPTQRQRPLFLDAVPADTPT